MSEPRLISPLLDNFAMGAPLSSHDGVSCCPALKENSEDKYIVKIISIPSSQRQLDALLLTGAYKDAAAATEYFKQMADDVVEEAKILRKLSKLEGFVSYEDWQIIPMEGNDLGYQVYLLSPYKLSLEKYMRRNLMTHLNAVNLGLDLCAAAAISRSSGVMYVDFKPSNIFISEDKEYRVGDLGFVKMDSLKYLSLPAKYLSRYTAPEVQDPMATLNTGVDIYAIGLILYQVYNNGELPFAKYPVAEVFPSPVNADYEMAEIIAKACAPDPAERWKDPIEMGQALIDYMQRNTVNDTPIAPPSVRIFPEEPEVKAPEAEEAAPVEEAPVPEANETETSEELAFMADMVNDETAPGEEDADESAENVSEEVTTMLEQADDLISHEIPEPAAEPEFEAVVAPVEEEEPAPTIAAVSTPAPAAPVAAAPVAAPVKQNSPAEDPFRFDDFDDEDDYDDFEYEDEDYDEEEDSMIEPGPRKPRKKTWLVFLIIGILAALLTFGGFYLYQNYYLQTIDTLSVEPHQDQVVVLIETDINEELLSVTCTDTYGNVMSQPVVNGKVTFTGLKPNTQYKVEAQITGTHKLIGSTYASFTSEEQTKIVNFTAVTGPQDGSAVLEFEMEGLETQDWTVTYSAEGEEAQTLPFTGTLVTINGLTVGKTYTFRLAPAIDLYLVGQDTLEFTASNIILAENLRITAITGESLTAQWDPPADVNVESWSVRCYSDTGYDQTVVISENTATFSGLTNGVAYTVEVTAAGMTQPVRTTLTADPITITAINVDDSDPSKLVVSWEFTGNAPEGGWLLLYTLDNGDVQSIATSTTNSVELEHRIPGATYHFEIQTAPAGSVFNATGSYTCPNAERFNMHRTNVDMWNFKFCRTPDKANWNSKDIKAGDYTNTFKVGEKISFVLTSSKHDIPDVNKTILFVIRDSEGNVVPDLVDDYSINWKQMWIKTYPKAVLTVPKAPTEPGAYKLYLYFDGTAVTVLDFTVTE